MSKDIEEDIKIFLEMSNKTSSENFNDLTKELVALNNNDIISDTDFNFMLKNLCSMYIELLAEKFIIRKIDNVFTLRSISL